ncbi:hypothetical protein BP5796_06146 [Coleophoma crateriformis]|uniref:Acyltransferase MbtK/IucB-like conserved domain-containing protein n=1 Tax=Coleophoma crateriformis TaxID=565419 RepID=A0A3D8RWT7_9HELO|nr:hypothetical protein BP5796_06146 [Coleophoma crateriformis]
MAGSSTKVANRNSPWEQFSICLPHPYLTRYHAQRTATNANNGSHYSMAIAPALAQKGHQRAPAFPLQNPALFFSTLEGGHEVAIANNTPWARARRSPSIQFGWTSVEAPTIAQIWLLAYSIFTVHYTEEIIRLSLSGSQCSLVAEEIITVGLAIPHPRPFAGSEDAAAWTSDELVLLRSAFWQGAGSPFGPRSAWLPPSSGARLAVNDYPILPTTQTITTRFPETRVHTLHPIRPAKPTPGSTIYSRYIPHLDEHYSMLALDYTNEQHLQLFHTWQNDPRVAAGWNEMGDLAHHLKYLKDLHEDLHTLTILACFDDVPFAYFEVYWGKEDHLGAYYKAGDWDRGRHSLVGDATYRGPARAHTWWSSLLHYMFLDDPRTEFAIGEPKYTNTRVLELDALHGFHVEKFVDLPHKRSAFVKCSRERYFGLCTVGMPYLGKQKDIQERL